MAELPSTYDEAIAFAREAGFEVGTDGHPAGRMMFATSREAFLRAEPTLAADSPLRAQEEAATAAYRRAVVHLIAEVLR